LEGLGGAYNKRLNFEVAKPFNVRPASPFEETP